MWEREAVVTRDREAREEDDAKVNGEAGEVIQLDKISQRTKWEIQSMH